MIRITLGWVFFEKSFLPNTETKGTKLSRKWRGFFIFCLKIISLAFSWFIYMNL